MTRHTEQKLEFQNYLARKFPLPNLSLRQHHKLSKTSLNRSESKTSLNMSELVSAQSMTHKRAASGLEIFGKKKTTKKSSRVAGPSP